MFLLPGDVFQIFHEYLRFRLEIQGFKEYCLTYKKWWGNNRNEYISGLRRFVHSYDKFMLLHGEVVNHAVEKFIQQANVTINAPKFTRESVNELYRFAHQLEIECDDELFTSFFVKRSFVFSLENFSKDVVEKTYTSIDAKQYDLAVVEAFKAFEEKITKILNVSLIDYSGNDLANFAFGSKSGKIQLETNDAEQQGLRNLYAGAYSLFRNPSAHRSVGNDEISANTIVALLSLLIRVVENNTAK